MLQEEYVFKISDQKSRRLVEITKPFSFFIRLLLVVGLVSERSLLPDLDDVVQVDAVVEQGVVVLQLFPLEKESLEVLGQIKPKVEIKLGKVVRSGHNIN